ncbi:MAG: YbhB/YbcL family Raf kinase inhibitor-like protein [Phycisphaeraceae bacterium]
MQITSPAFQDGQVIPRRYTEDGDNTSPPLSWNNVPEKTREFALIMEDPDAPRPDPWVHWVAYSIPRDLRNLPGRIPHNLLVTLDNARFRQGINSWGEGHVGYRGPSPPPGHGTHRYYFHLYALDRPLSLGEAIEKDALLAAISRVRVLDEAILLGRYEREPSPVAHR